MQRWTDVTAFTDVPNFALQELARFSGRRASLYGLRWDAPDETAYPSTIVIDRQGIVRFVEISHSHGNRSAAPEILAVLQGLR